MKTHSRHALFISATAVVLCFATLPANAGGAFGMHIGSSGFGVSVGFGDWGVYTRSWSDPYWSLDFNSALSGYGKWVWVNGLGRVWCPWVSVGWRPYTYGRWVATGAQWTWVAYEPWGYIPHHYGSWAYCSFGWVWQPGYTYHHSNVVWARSASYVGWYARPPHGWSHAAHGFRHGYRHGYRDGYSDGWHDARYGTYVDWSHFGSDNVSHHSVTHSVATRDRLESTSTQPSASEVRRRGGVAPAQTQLSRRTVRMGGQEIVIARPEGVAASIERHAADAAAGALAPEALARRQPLVRSRNATASAAGSASRGVSSAHRESRTREVRTPSAGAPAASRDTSANLRVNGTRDHRRRQTSSSVSRSSRSAPTVVPRTAAASANGVKPSYTNRTGNSTSRSSVRGAAVRETSANRHTAERRSGTAGTDHRSENTGSARTSPQSRRGAAKPEAASAQRTTKKPHTRATTGNRSSTSTERKRPRQRSTGTSRR